MDREQSQAKIARAEKVASLMERAVHLNGAGAETIRELTDHVRNFEQADQAMGLIADRYERLIVELDKVLQANLAFQKEMVGLFKRVAKIEKYQARHDQLSQQLQQEGNGQ